jgi:hypothetical protein
MVAVCSCSLRHYLPGGGAQPAAAPASGNQAGADQEQAQASPAATPSAGAKIQILYTHRGDYLTSLTVTKYSTAAILRNRPSPNGTVSMVRFDGGEPVWKIEVNRGFSPLLSPLPGMDENKKFAVTEISYGDLPAHFMKDLPTLGDPEPLQPGFYYIFSVVRAVGPPSYQAVFVTPDGAIEGYDAQPLIGSSYEICCSVAPDFAGPAPGDDQTGAGGGP